MSEISSEQRLRLVNQIRQEHHQNRQSIQSRERIMYGNESSTQNYFLHTPNHISSLENNPVNINISSVSEKSSTFGLRMLIAAILFVAYFFIESKNINLGTLDAELIRTEVNRYSGAEINLFDFMDNFTYTFNND